MKRLILVAALAGCGLLPIGLNSTSATPLSVSAGAGQPDSPSDIELVRGRGGGGGMRRGGGGGRAANFNRGGNRNVNVNRNVNRNINRNVTRNVNVNRGRWGGWARPGYRWRPGGAIAAGAALGFVSAATAAAWAGAAPGPGLCWYYSDPSRTAGFWDACP
jgi:hypothetical protein